MASAAQAGGAGRGLRQLGWHHQAWAPSTPHRWWPAGSSPSSSLWLSSARASAPACSRRGLHACGATFDSIDKLIQSIAKLTTIVTDLVRRELLKSKRSAEQAQKTILLQKFAGDAWEVLPPSPSFVQRSLAGRAASSTSKRAGVPCAPLPVACSAASVANAAPSWSLPQFCAQVTKPSTCSPFQFGLAASESTVSSSSAQVTKSSTCSPFQFGLAASGSTVGSSSCSPFFSLPQYCAQVTTPSTCSSFQAVGSAASESTVGSSSCSPSLLDEVHVKVRDFSKVDDQFIVRHYDKISGGACSQRRSKVKELHNLGDDPLGEGILLDILACMSTATAFEILEEYTEGRPYCSGICAISFGLKGGRSSPAAVGGGGDRA